MPVNQTRLTKLSKSMPGSSCSIGKFRCSPTIYSAYLIALVNIKRTSLFRLPVLSLVLFFLVCAWPVSVNAQIEAAVQSFDEGNDLYRTGNYQDAIDAYRKAIDGGYTSGALYYNLGNAYYRLDELGQAVRYYEKARLLTPENAELLHNLEIAAAKSIDQFSQLPAPIWVKWWRTTTARTGGKWFFWLGLLFYILAITIIVYRIRTSSRNPWVRRARAISVLLGLIFLVAAFVASVNSVATAQAVILVEQVDLKEEPDTASNTELAIHEGLVVDIIQNDNDWLEVRLPNGAHGWVPADVIGDI